MTKETFPPYLTTTCTNKSRPKRQVSLLSTFPNNITPHIKCGKGRKQSNKTAGSNNKATRARAGPGQGQGRAGTYYDPVYIKPLLHQQPAAPTINLAIGLTNIILSNGVGHSLSDTRSTSYQIHLKATQYSPIFI